MKIFSLLLVFLIYFQSCSSSDAPMMDEQETQMQEMQMEEENMPPNNTSTFQGDFMSSAHPTSGKASVNEAKTTLSFTNFKTDTGPILEVYLATDTSASTYVSLGVLKGINGNYDYELPNTIDLKVYNHVIIWCVDFKVNFGYAVLK